MLTALKSARLNGVPFGIEEREREKKMEKQNETEGREERGGKNKTN